MIIQSLGMIPVPTPGTVVPLSATQLMCWKYRVQVVVGGTGKIHLGTTALNSTTGAGEIKTFWPTGTGGGIPDSWTEDAGTHDNVIDLSKLCLDAQNAGEGAIVSYWIR